MGKENASYSSFTVVCWGDIVLVVVVVVMSGISVVAVVVAGWQLLTMAERSHPSAMFCILYKQEERIAERGLWVFLWVFLESAQNQ